MQERQVQEERSLSELFSTLTEDIATLVRQEIQLARTELTEKGVEAGTDVALVAAGGALAGAGMFAFVSAAISLLATILPRWLAALVVGGALSGTGAALAYMGLQNLRDADLVPHRTIESIKDDAEIIKESLT
jgi:hypothetical protein